MTGVTLSGDLIYPSLISYKQPLLLLKNKGEENLAFIT